MKSYSMDIPIVDTNTQVLNTFRRMVQDFAFPVSNVIKSISDRTIIGVGMRANIEMNKKRTIHRCEKIIHVKNLPLRIVDCPGNFFQVIINNEN